jgi:hypothetical protein
MDHDLLVKLLELSTSPHDGEALQALRRANAAIRDSGRCWADLLEPAHELEVATAAAAHLLAEIETLKAENERLRLIAGPRADMTLAEGWGTVGDHVVWASDALALDEAGLVRLTDAERDLAIAVKHWPGEPGEPQRQALADLRARILSEEAPA